MAEVLEWSNCIFLQNRYSYRASNHHQTAHNIQIVLHFKCIDKWQIQFSGNLLPLKQCFHSHRLTTRSYTRCSQLVFELIWLLCIERVLNAYAPRDVESAHPCKQPVQWYLDRLCIHFTSFEKFTHTHTKFSWEFANYPTKLVNI